MSFNEGDLHERYADVFRAMGMDVPREFTRERHDRLIEGIARCRDMNAASVIEINRQERVIEDLREKEAAYMDANHEQGMQLIEQDKRIRELESLLEDVWPYVWELRIPGRRDEEFEARFKELGLEASE